MATYVHDPNENPLSRLGRYIEVGLQKLAILRMYVEQGTDKEELIRQIDAIGKGFDKGIEIANKALGLGEE